jgi:hypothetical protein
MDCYFRQYWRDKRLSFKSPFKSLSLSIKVRRFVGCLLLLEKQTTFYNKQPTNLCMLEKKDWCFLDKVARCFLEKMLGVYWRRCFGDCYGSLLVGEVGWICRKLLEVRMRSLKQQSKSTATDNSPVHFLSSFKRQIVKHPNIRVKIEPSLLNFPP